MIFNIFSPILFATAKLFIMVMIGYFLIKRKILSSTATNDLSKILINITLPCLLFVKVANNFDLDKIASSLILMASALISISIGLILSFSLLKITKLLDEKKWEYGALASIANTGYLPITIAASILPADQSDIAIYYISMYLMVFSPILWTFGSWAITSTMVDKSSNVEKPSIFMIIPPPLIATVMGVVFAATPLKYFISGKFVFIADSLDQVGSMTIPLSMIVLGGILASINIKSKIANTRPLLIIILIRVFLAPILILIGMISLKLDYLLGLIILIEGCMPTAISLSIIAKRWGADYEFAAKVVFITHFLSLFTIPLYIVIYNSYKMI